MEETTQEYIVITIYRSQNLIINFEKTFTPSWISIRQKKGSKHYIRQVSELPQRVRDCCSLNNMTLQQQTFQGNILLMVLCKINDALDLVLNLCPHFFKKWT